MKNIIYNTNNSSKDYSKHTDYMLKGYAVNQRRLEYIDNKRILEI